MATKLTTERKQPVGTKAAGRTMRILWPPPNLGLGTPLNLASLSALSRQRLGRRLAFAPLLGVAIVLLLAGIDLAVFRA